MQTVYFKPTNNERFPFPLSVEGESHYQKNIREVILYKEFVEKDDNKFDPGNAVRVAIDNLTVGYLSREDAKTYRTQLQAMNLSDTIGACNAAAYGKREEGKTMKFGIWLALIPPTPRICGCVSMTKGTVYVI